MFFSHRRSCCCGCLDASFYYYSITNPGGCNCPPTCEYIKISKDLIDGGYNGENGGEICFNSSCELIEDTLCCNVSLVELTDPCTIPNGAIICEVGPPSP